VEDKMQPFEEFYESIGFKKYPFRERTAEKENIEKLFIAPPDYSIISEAFQAGETAIISGNRGTGKTMLLQNIKKRIPPNTIIADIENYEGVPTTKNQIAFYALIVKNVVAQTLVYLSNNKKSIKKLNKEDKIFLSFLIMKYADYFTGSEVATKIENVQLHPLKRLINKASTPITLLLNFGTTAAANFGYTLLNDQFSKYLPPVNEGQIKKIFPDIHFAVANDFKSVDISYSLLDKTLLLIEKLQNKKAIIIFDKFDEDTRLENDAELTADFIKELICDNNLLLNKHAQFFISIWEIPFTRLLTSFRKSKHTVFSIYWRRDELEKVLNRRLSIYSDGKIQCYKTLFAADVSVESINQIFNLSNMNPRDLWAVFDSIFNEQYKIGGKIHTLSENAITGGLVTFVKSFGFYEYYPKKKSSRKNTNDVYSYIRHLLQLNNMDEFTQDQLRTAASTGGSTTNYITGMMAIGLVTKTDIKRPGGAVVYKVHDPKVSYAIFNKIAIDH